MKKIFLCIVTLIILVVACGKNCKIKQPKNVKPIDWNNYNDVYTVHWNYYSCCDEINREDEGKIIKISGWKAWSYHAFNLCGDPKYADRNLGYTAAFPFVTIQCNLPEFKAKLDTCDLKKKCFVKGKILLFEEIYPSGCFVYPTIEVTDIDDIYFE